MPVKFPKREKHEAWPLLADGAQIWVDSGSTARATHRSLRLPDTFCSICDRAIRLRAQVPTTLHHHQPSAARVCTVDSATVDIASAGLWPCTSCTSLHAAPNMRHLHELACQAHWRRFRRAPCPSTAVLPGSASSCTVASSNMTCTACVTCCHLLFSIRVRVHHLCQRLRFCGVPAHVSRMACHC